MAQDNLKNSTPTGDAWGENDKPASTQGSADWGAGDKEYRPDSPARGFKGWAQDIAATAVKGAIGVPEAIVGLADIPTGGAVGKFLENEDGAVGFRPKQAREIVNDWHSDATKEAQRKFQEADGIVDKAVTAIQNPSLIATAVGESLPSMGAGGVAARGLMAAAPRIAPWLAGAIGEGVAGAGSAAEQIRQETKDGLLTPEQSALAAATGVATTAFGAAGGKLANRLGIGDAETMIAQGQQGLRRQIADQAATAAANPLTAPAAQSALRRIPESIVKGAIAEGFLEELPQSVAEQVFQNIALGKPWHEDVDAAAVMGVLSGGAMGGAASGYRAFLEPSATGAHAAPAPAAPGAQPGAQPPSPGLERVREAFTAQLQALQQQEQGEPDVPQTTPPDGAAVLARQRAEQQAARDAQIAAGRAEASPDDEIYQSTGADTAPPSVRMGLDPAAGPLSAGAAMAVDTGATDQMQQAAAAAQAAEAAEKGGGAKKAAPEAVDQQTGEVAAQDGGMATWSDAELSNAFRGAQSREARMGLAQELATRRIQREQQALLAELDAEQVATVPGAERADTTFAALTEDAGQVPADLTIPTTEGNRNGHQADQAQQDRAQPPQGGAAPAIARGAPDAQGSAGAPDARAAAGVADAAPTTANPGTQAAAAPGAQTAPQAEDRAQRIADAGSAWTRMPTAERQAVAGRLGGVKPVIQKNLHRAQWENLNADIQRKLADAMAPAAPVAAPTTEESTAVATAPEAPTTFDSAKHPEQWWGVALPAEREKLLLDAGWKAGSPNMKTMHGAAWSDLNVSQRGRLTKALEGRWNASQAATGATGSAQKPAEAVDVQTRDAIKTEANAAQDSQDETQWTELTPAGRRDAMERAGVKLPDRVLWQHVSEAHREKLRPAVAAVLAADTAGPATPAAAPVSQPETESAAKSSAGAASASTADQFANNKLFTADKVAAARERMRKKLSTPFSGLDPELMVDGMTIAGAYIESGVRNFTQYAKAMIGDMGEGVKPYLLSFWEGARNYPGLDAEGMTDPAESARQHQALLTPEAHAAAPEIGQEVAALVLSDARRTMEARSSATQNDTQNATPVPTAELPTERQGRAGENAAPGDRDSQPLDDGLAQAREGTAGSRPVPAAADRAGGSGAPRVQRAGEPAPGAARDSGAVRPEQRGADAVAPQADPATAEASAKPELDQPGDHTIDAADIGKGGLVKKYRDNIEAIRIIKAMATEGRVATPAERKVIARYVGWGALKGVFDQDNKQWSKEFAELRELLTDAEYKAARASTLNAHFTSPDVVGAIFQFLDRLGFAHGRVLEPSVGVGNFFGLMPASMRKASQLHGVELDPLTSKIAAALYPSAKIAKATGFQDFEVPGGYFDLAIGNPPFGSEPIVDDARSPYSGASIHNYFFAKSIDKLRPGGLLAMVVSHNFLDAKNDTTRRWIADRANLIGAVRLPNTAFKENAGTEVVTDIVIFQKKTESERANGLGDDAWVKAGTQRLTTAKGEDTDHNVSGYFLSNPANVLGTPTAAGSMYRAGEYTVDPSGNLAEQLKAWAENLPQGLFQPVERTHEPEAANVSVPDGVKVGSFFVSDDGKVLARGEDSLGERTATAWAPPNARAKERMVGMIGLRDALRAQMRLERSPDATDEQIEAHRRALNERYDEFKRAYGYVNDATNRRIFLDDTEAALLLALEFDYDRGVSRAVAEREDIEPRAPSATKADIFERRVMFPPADNIKVTSARDALLASLNYKGALDLGYMAQLYDKSQADILAELGDVVYADPLHGPVMADEYLSGDVKTKLAEAEAAALDDPAYKRNVAALKKVIPADKKPSEIHAALGASFVPAEYFAQFAKEVTGANATVGYVRATAQWIVNFTGQANASLDTGKWGIGKMPATAIFIRTMAGQGVVVTETHRNADGSTTTTVLEKETTAAREKQAAMKAEWQRWLWSDPDRADKLAAIYNDKMNRIVPRKYDGSHLTFPGMSPAMALLDHQKNAVWRALQSRQVLFDHVVGAGKTFEVVALFMEMRRLGIARKPFIAVPNHLTLQWRSEFSRLYPAANVLAATPDDFAKGNREKFFSKIVTGDWDAVIVGHSSLKKIALPVETEKAILEEQVAEIAAAIEDMKRSRGDRHIVRDMEGIKARLEARMKQRLQALGDRDKVVSFDDLGVDAFAVDELHEFKNLFYNSTMERVPGMGNPSGSDKAFDLFVKLQWMFQTYGDKAPIAGATGTPVSNSLVEMFNMQRFLQYPTLKRDGLHVFDAWAKQFGSVESLYEVSPSGTGYRQSSRFAKFKNLPALMANYQTFADTVTLDDLKAQEEARGKAFPVPKVAGGRPVNVVAKRSPQVANFMGVPQLDIQGGKVQFGFNGTDAVEIKQNDNSESYSATATGEDADGKPLTYLLGTAKTPEDARLMVVEQALSPKIKVDPKSILGQFADLKRLNKETKGKVNALSLTGQANKAGLDYRLIDPAAPDFDGSKVNLAIERMMATYEKWNADKGTQLVFCDLSVPLSARSGFAGKERRVYVRDQGALVHKKGTMHTVPGHEQLPFFVVKEASKDSKTFAVYDAATGLRLTGGMPAKGVATDWAAQTLADDAKRQRWIDARDALGDIEQDAIDDYNNANEIDTEETEAITLADIAGASGAQGFSVYDDIKAKLIARGVPEREIAFIHDYGTPIAKDKLFKQVKRGDVRFLLGSTPKMGAGTNVQDLLVGLHHIDAPWRPSDLEQREGRIIRRGNTLYARDPEGFEVEIYRYATEQTYDTRRWQILEHKARGIEQLRNYDGTLNEIDDIEGEAANSADMKAAASGDPLILEETQLRNDVRRLESLQAAHADGSAQMVRGARDNQRFATEYGPKTLAELQALKTKADAHPVHKDEFVGVTVGGKRIADREDAIKAMRSAMSRALEEGGGVETITYRGLDFTLERSGHWLELNSPTGSLERTDPEREALPSVAGFLTRFANYINRLPAHIADLEAKIEDAKAQAVQMREQAAKPFEQAKALDDAREAHKKVQRRLIAKGPDIPVNQRAQLKTAMEQQKEALRAAGFGEALDEFLGSRDDFAGVKPGKAGTGTPTDRSIMNLVREGRGARDILNMVAGTSRSRFNRQVARLLLKAGVTPAVRLDQADLGGADGFTFLAKYSRQNDALTLTPGAQSQAEHIFLHEMIHAATLRALDRKGLASLQMRRLYEHAKRQGGAAGQYGMKNVGEFVAEAFTNPEFQKALRAMSAPPGGTLKSAWDSLVRILRSILGLHQDSHDALSRALELGVQVMREDMALRQRGVAARGGDAQTGVEQTQTEAFKRWYGDWQNVGHETTAPDTAARGPLDAAAGAGGVRALRGQENLGAAADRGDAVVRLAGGAATFNGASGPTGEGGAPLRLYHGTRDDIRAFDLNHPNRKDHGWLGEGVYLTSSDFVAGQYAKAKRGEHGPSVMPLYADVRNPYVATKSEKTRIKIGGKPAARAFTERVKALGHDGVALDLGEGVIELVAFESTQVKSAIGNNGNFDPNDRDVSHFGAADLSRMKSSALAQIDTLLSHPGKVSLWDKTVGTMRNLAERNPLFKPVYEAAQRFIDDVSMLANDAADRAPRLLPRVDSWRDLAKKPISAQDNKAVARPLFEGTLMWGRDVDGKPALVEDLSKKYAHLPAAEKARILRRLDRIDAGVLRMWQGLPQDRYESLIASRFESQVLKAGLVWKDAELRDLFQASPEQIELYREARQAIDRSIDMTARADMLRALGVEFAGMRDAVLAHETLDGATELISRTLQDMATDPDGAERAGDLQQLVTARYDKAKELMAQGYAPLSRFGRYTVDVVSPDGTREYFGMFESAAESNKMKAAMEKEFPGAAVTQGTMSDEAYKLFQGITPESLEQFGNMLGLSGEGAAAHDKAFQAYLQLAKNNHSALKRLIHRKGIAGYSEDVGRVLASFVYSNARLAAGGLNAGTLEKATEGIPKEQGELRDVAMGLRSYIQDPQEEGQAVRGMLFAQYLGGSVASAMVNMTQPFQITMPYLSQFGGMKKAAGQLARALKDMGTRGMKYEPDLASALHAAEEDGTVSPQEIHQLMAQARGAGTLRSGDGTRVGDARAAAANNWERVKVAWGQPFALAEQFNRRSTFIAAYRLAKEQGIEAPAEFARRAVVETQFVYSKANKPKWARGAIGGTLFTFKTYSVSYLELMHRMWTQGGPEGKRAVGWAVAMLLLMGGAGGLPFMEDAEDLIDGAGQLMGYNVSTKRWRKELLANTLGKELGEFVEQGVSGLPGAPVDVSGRLGMGNLIPGTGLFLSKQNRERDLLEIAGPAGDLVARGFTGARKALTGDVAGAALEVSPTAVRNAAKGIDMATSGIYKDAKGYKVIDTTLGEALSKAAGFQPRSVAEVQEANSFMQRSKSFYIQTSNDIKAQWAQALFNKDDAALERVRARLAAWNRDNPEQPIVVKMPDVWKKVREMGKDRTQRIADTAPKALRQQMREMARENG